MLVKRPSRTHPRDQWYDITNTQHHGSRTRAATFSLLTELGIRWTCCLLFFPLL